MSDIAGIPYIEAEFDKNGNPVGPTPTFPAGTNEVFVFSHGWNNNHTDARNLYKTFFTNYVKVGGPAPAGRKRCIVGILWPSKALDDVVKASVANASAGGAASAGGGNSAAADAVIKAQLDEVEKMLGPGSASVIGELKDMLSEVEDDPALQRKFVDTLRAQLTSRDTGNDEEPSSHAFLKTSGPALLTKLGNPAPQAEAGAPKATSTTSDGGAAGLAGNIFNGIKGGIINFLNLFSYFEMKERAGTVGSKGVANLLNTIGNSADRIHLMGHSFGGRVVTAAAMASTTGKIKSMSLLQAAFSHNGFQPEKGFFRSVIERSRVAGPIVITHTFNDSAVGIAYPAASLISGETAAGASTAGLAAKVGGPSSPFGGLGSNGALHLGNTITVFGDMRPVGTSYTFAAGKVYNLKADPFISEHGDVANETVAHAVASAHAS